MHEWSYDLEEEPKTFVDDEGNVIVEKEKVENVVTWVYDQTNFNPTAKIQDDKTYSIISDYLGTPILAYNEEGEKVWERELDIYGTAINETNHFIPFIYQGQYYDDDIELAYNRFRYYNPESGRYIHKDKIGLCGGTQLYSYVWDVNKLLEKFGLFPEYYDLDYLGRPTGGFAELTESTIGTGTSASNSINPPGWQGGEHPYHQQRGHLIANNHGGSGTDPKNLVTITDGTNHPGMTKFENKITNHVKAGNTVLIEVRPVIVGII